MKYLLLFAVCGSVVMTSLSASAVDCSFDEAHHGFCRWKRERNESKKAGWRIGYQIRRTKFKNRKYPFFMRQH